MKRMLASVTAAALVFGVSVQTTWATAKDEKNCGDFATWKEAQTYFESKGGSKLNNVDNLDADKDGLACETNKDFDANHKNPNDAKQDQSTTGENKDNKTGNIDEQKPVEEPKQEEPKNEEPKNNQPQPCSEDDYTEDKYFDITVDSKQVANGNVKITAKLEGAKEAEGTWYIGAGLEEAENPAIEEAFEGVKGTTFTYELDINKLETGLNVVIVGFEGTVDGKNCSFGVGFHELEVEEDDSMNPVPDKEQPKTPESPKQGKEAVKQIKGGKLPKTATSYPTAAIAGLLLLAMGAMALRVRRA